MKTVILDDDPTGTQSASDAQVLLDASEEELRRVLSFSDSVYVLTNSRALDEAAAVQLVGDVRAASLRVAAELGVSVQFVLRGDSTLRGHVFAESEVFLDDDPEAVLLFVPAFPDGGRVTVDGMHYVTLDGRRVPAHETEFADDPVFPFRNGDLVRYVSEKSRRGAISASLVDVRGGDLTGILRSAPAGFVVVPDAETDDDIRAIADAVTRARADGARIVVRSASPLAAALAGVSSHALLPRPLVEGTPTVLVVCGSHTAGASAQLDAIDSAHPGRIVLSTDDALRAARPSADQLAARTRDRLQRDGVAVLTTERVRSSTHNTLDHGERVMRALTAVVRAAYADADVVVAKGGITSAEVARTGLGARHAVVLGQVLPGVSVWRLTAEDRRSLLYVVVPGNVGRPDTISEVLRAMGVDTEKHA